MKKEISNIIEESLFNEVKKTILNENKDPKEVYHITCEGEPVDSFESEEIAMTHLDIYKKKHPEKEFIIEKKKYESTSEMIDKLDQMGEELEKNKEIKKMKKVTVSGLSEAAMLAKTKGLKEFKFNGESYNLDEYWKGLEEEEMCEGGCGQGYMEEESDVEESNAFVLAADAAKDSGKEEFEFPKGSGKMHKVTIKKDIEVNEGKKTCSECGGMMNEEGICEGGCGSGRMEESKKTKLRLTESELVSLIKKMVSKSKVNESKEDGEKMELFYVMNDKDQVKNISKKESDAEKFLEKSLKGEGKIKSKTVYKKDYDNEKVTVSTIKNYTLNESVPGLMVTKKAQSGSKKESDDYMKDVEQKLKKISTFDGNDNPEFPKQIGKGEKMAINPTEEQDEIIADNRGGGMEDLNYDYEPSENFKKRLKMALEGDPKMGNSQDAANVIKTDTGKNLAKKSERKKEKESENFEVSWGHSWKDPENITTVKESKTTMSSVLEEEIKRMKRILGYDESTQ
jgi:hypothetical protein